MLEIPNEHWLDIIGRVHPGAEIASLQAQMRVVLQQWLRSHLADMDANQHLLFPKQTLYLGPGGAGITAMRQQYEHWLQILMMVSGFVLLIVCANVANLMLFRGLERRQQTSLSMALGAGRGRIVRQALTESIVLSLLGGAAGLGVAFAGTQVLLRFTFGETSAVPITADPSLPVLLFAFGISLLTGMIFGIAPAWISTRVDPVEALRGAQRSTRHAGSLSRRTLVVLQAALSLTLLSASGLLTATLQKLERQDLGFQQEGRTVIGVDPVLAGYQPEQLDLLYRRIHHELASLPGVVSVAVALYSPMSGDTWNEGLYVEGKPAPGPSTDNGASWARVTAGFFETIGNPVIKGRPIDERDTASSPHVAVVNEAFARKFFKNEDPLGKHFGKDDMKYAGDYEIVGVAKDSRYIPYDIDKPIRAFFFLPATQSTSYTGPVGASSELRSHYMHDIVVRTQPGIVLALPAVRRALASVDPNLPLMRKVNLRDQVAGNFGQQRLIARLTSLFGMLALVLASIGIYGITAYNVGSRTNEIGVRMALGAGRRSVLVLILRGAFLLIATGLLAGIPLSLFAGRFLGSQLYGFSPYDPIILSVAILALSLSAFIAALIPAFRASGISPMQALRAE
jgi:predicted permease